MSLAAGTRLGPYEIVAAIGAGGMGEVYRARDTRLDRPVAIKVLPAALSQDASLRQRFEREARVISSFDHPHICGLLDIGHDAGHDYLVMQFLEGVTLAARLEGGALPAAEALNIGAQVADALAAAHARGIIHRDVKPANIMLTATGVRLLDFGLARVTVEAGMQMRETTAALTAQRTILGTLHYMAPEQVDGRQADARSDVFSLGAVLYEMLAGTRAFEGDSPASVMAAIIRAERIPLTDASPLTPPWVQTIVDRCLARNPDERWQSASDLAFALRSMTATPPAARGPVRTRRRKAVTVAAVLGAAAAGVATGALLSRPQAPPPERGEVRLTLLPPAGQEFAATFTNFDTDFAVSPDGAQVAFVTVDAAGVRRLWIRPLSSSTARALSGTEGATRPFWSPDSRFIAFNSDAGISRIALPDGTPQVIVPAALVDRDSHGSWGRGKILFDAVLQGYATTTGAADVDLWVVEPRPDAEPHVLLELPRNQYQGQFSPDGKWLAYTSDESGEPQVYVRALPSSHTRIQISAHGGAQPRWRGDGGELFYVAPDCSVTAVTIDRSGEPGRPVVLFREPSLRTSNSARFYGGAPAYAVKRDGSRFLVNRMTREPAAGPLEICRQGGSPAVDSAEGIEIARYRPRYV